MNKEDILFPHPEIRESQDKIIEIVQASINNKQPLLLNAPTGLGKTDTTLPIALSYALKNNLTVFFITPKHTQHKIAVESLKKIKQIYKRDFIITDLIGKKWMCLQEGSSQLKSSQFAEYCKEVKEKGECSFYNKTIKKSMPSNLALSTFHKLKTLNPLHIQEVIKICNDHQLCPYEVSLLLAKESKVIIADYHHIFNESIRQILFEKSNKTLEKCIIIIDEAHNLPERLRDLLSTNLSSYVLNQSIKEANDMGEKEISSILKKINESILRLSQSTKFEESESLIKKSSLIKEIESIGYYEAIIEKLNSIAEEIRIMKKRSFIGSVANFLSSWLGPDEGFTRILSKQFFRDKPNIIISYKCLDPSLASSNVINNSHSCILMSGTLSPISMYVDLLGIKNHIKAEFPSIFPKENRLNIIIPETTTKFTERSSKMYEDIAIITSNLTNIIPGNSLVFFPSYDVRDKISQFFQDRSDKSIFFEQQGLSKSDRDELLEKFKTCSSKGSVLLATSSGSFSEGIDLPGDYLKSVIIVGLPLATPDLEIRELIKYYDIKFNRGWDYGYIFPAIIKSLQAAGRCIRSEQDRGVIVFLDKRFAMQHYSRCFPSDLNFVIEKNPYNLIEEFFKK